VGTFASGGSSVPFVHFMRLGICRRDKHHTQIRTKPITKMPLAGFLLAWHCFNLNVFTHMLL